MDTCSAAPTNPVSVAPVLWQGAAMSSLVVALVRLDLEALLAFLKHRDVAACVLDFTGPSLVPL